MYSLLSPYRFVLFFFPFLLVNPTCAQIGSQTGNWGMQPNRTYRNPILAGDYSDPDVLYENGEYYLVTSTFWFSPGISILRSKDLVSWEAFGSVVPDIVKAFENDTSYGWQGMNQYSDGIYAPSIRKHNGTYFIYYNAVSTGFYVSTAAHIAGPWKTEALLDKIGRQLLTGKLWDDPCPIWTSDGKAYLVASKFGGAWYPHLFQMTPDGKQLLDGNLDTMSHGGFSASDGTVIWNVYTSEGNKYYFWNGYHYFWRTQLLSGSSYRGGFLMRSKNIYGTLPDGSPGSPGNAGSYEHQQVINPGAPATARDPTQGTILQDKCGSWWFITQSGILGPEGRPLSLLPVTWNASSGFPIIGINPISGAGQFTWNGGTSPCQAKNTSHVYPQGSDNFNSPDLSHRWAWNYQPRADFWSLRDRPGFLRLRAWNQISADNFDTTGNIIMQKYFRSNSIRVTVKIDFKGFIDGQIGGLAHWAPKLSSSSITVYQPTNLMNISSPQRQIVVQTTGNGKSAAAIPQGKRQVWLRSVAKFDNIQTFSYSFDGKEWTAIGGSYVLASNAYRGSLIALFTYNNLKEGGWMDVDNFEYCFDHGRGLEC